MEGSCLCGRVTVEVPGRPDYLNACNCAACMKLGTLWGYFPVGEVRIEGSPARYVREDIAQPHLGFDFCEQCGTAIDWAPIGDGMPDRMGVNMRLFDPAALRGIEVRYGDRRNHSTNPRHYYREPNPFDGAGAIA